MTRLLIINQCYYGDRDAAMENARLIADMMPARREDVAMMFAHARNCPADMEAIRYVGRKMHTEVFHSDRIASGHPSGCNALFFAAYDWFCSGVKRRGWQYDVALFLESDMCPTRLTWLDELIAEWESKGKLVGGFLYTEKCHPFPHINGGLLISPKFRELHKDFIWAHDSVGWDCQWGKELIAQAYASKLFWMEYNRATIDEKSLFSAKRYAKYHPLAKHSIKAALIHGVKDGSARAIVRQKFLNAQGSEKITGS